MSAWPLTQTAVFYLLQFFRRDSHRCMWQPNMGAWKWQSSCCSAVPVLILLARYCWGRKSLKTFLKEELCEICTLRRLQLLLHGGCGFVGVVSPLSGGWLLLPSMPSLGPWQEGAWLLWGQVSGFGSGSTGSIKLPKFPMDKHRGKATPSPGVALWKPAAATVVRLVRCFSPLTASCLPRPCYPSPLPPPRPLCPLQPPGPFHATAPAPPPPRFPALPRFPPRCPVTR